MSGVDKVAGGGESEEELLRGEGGYNREAEAVAGGVGGGSGSEGSGSFVKAGPPDDCQVLLGI